jgi:hypothetical protein
MNLIIAGLRSIEVAALTDSIKASLRNTLSNVTGRDCQELQDSFEQQARAPLKSAKQ